MSLRERCQRRGGKWGVRSLRLALANEDNDRDGEVTQQELVAALGVFGVRCPHGHSDLCNFLSQFPLSTTSFAINLILEEINGTIQRTVLQAACAAYEKICVAYKATQHGEVPTVGFICQVALINRHPDVESNLVTLRDGLFCFFTLWGLPVGGLVSQALFLEFHCDLLSGKSLGTALELLQRLYNVSPSQSTAPSLVPSRKASDQIFDSVDTNKNGMLSLAELDLAVIRLWPTMNDKRAIMRAYKLADARGDGNGTLSRSEFHQFIHFLAQYTKVVELFKALDTNRDGRISFDELRVSKARLGLEKISDNELRHIFSAMDANSGGKVLFEEFAVFIAKKRGDEAMSRVTNEF